MEKFDENKDSELFEFGLYDWSEDDDECDAGELSMPLDLSYGSMDLSGVLEEPLTSTPAKSEKPKSKLTCDQCGNTYKTKYGLNIHRMKHTGHFKHVCVICNQGFGQTEQFKSHVASHNKLAVSKCDDCGKSFTGHSSLRRHTLVCGKKNVTSEFYCDQCALEFNTKEYLRAHQRGKHQEPRYICDKCGKAFAWRSSLKVHKKGANEQDNNFKVYFS